MGFLIPENIPSRNDVPALLQEVARCLRDMVDDSVSVWLHPTNHEPVALLVLDPSAGVVLMDAPSPAKLGLLKPSGFPRRSSMAPGLDVIQATAGKRARLVERLVEAEERLGVEFPTAGVLAFPSLAVREFRRLSPEGQPAEYLLQEDFTKEGLRSAIVRVLRGPAVRPLSEPEERLVRGALKPEIIIHPLSGAGDDGLLFTPPECNEDLMIRVLDRRQERLAHDLGSGYRVIRGVAGSGKSLVLVHRARYLSENFPGHRFLLTCYNTPLSLALREQVGDVPRKNITVRTVDSLAKEFVRMNPTNDNEWAIQRERAVVVARKMTEAAKYDAVFVDEAQDLDPPALDLAHALLKKGREDFVVALDGAQNVYRKTARWNPPGMTARGRTKLLQTCYRNTREIMEFAWRFLNATNVGIVSDDRLDDPTLLVRPEATSRRGPLPIVLQCESARAEVDEIVRRIRKASADGAAWGQVVVLYGARKGIVDPLLSGLQKNGVPNLWVSDPKNRENRKRVVSAGDVVRVSTMQGLKGLEFSRVFLCGVNDIYDAGADDETHRRKIAYVAMTRAMDELIITVSGSGPIGQAIQAARTATARPKGNGGDVLPGS